MTIRDEILKYADQMDAAKANQRAKIEAVRQQVAAMSTEQLIEFHRNAATEMANEPFDDEANKELHVRLRKAAAARRVTAATRP